MKASCKICGYTGESTWRNGRFYCAACGSEVSSTPEEAKPVEAVVSAPVQVKCPICENEKGNTLRDGKYRCALCGTLFDLPQKPQSRPAFSSAYEDDDFGYSLDRQPDWLWEMDQEEKKANRKELEKEQNKKIIWGIVWLFLFWPVSIYFFYKAFKISREVSRL